MLIKYPSVQFQSISELKKFASQNSLVKFQNSSTSLHRNNSSHKRFVPFCQERNLGRLLSKKNGLNQTPQGKDSIEKLLEMVTFKNFKKLYRMEKKAEEAKYAQKIRESGQKNLINQNEWVLNDIRQKSTSLNHSNHKRSKAQISHPTSRQSTLHVSRQLSSSKLRTCCKSTQLSKNPSKQKSKSFNKIDLQLYKKLAANRPPQTSDPQLNTLYEHYVQSCELNENERRRFLTQRKK